MTSAAAIGLVNGLMWATLFYFAVRHRSVLSILVVVGAWGTNLMLGTDHVFEGNLNRTWVSALIVYLLIDRLDKDPTHVKNVMALQLDEARRELHEAHADRASWEARAVGYEHLLVKHNLKP